MNASHAREEGVGREEKKKKKGKEKRSSSYDPSLQGHTKKKRRVFSYDEDTQARRKASRDTPGRVYLSVTFRNTPKI